VGQGTENGRRHRGGKLYRCRARVEVQTNYGPSTGTCGAWLHRAYIAKGSAKYAVAIGWFCEACGGFIRGDDPLAGVELEGNTRYNDADQIMAEFFKRRR
jgi:hypothetical protein